jgi:hypothetical protein
MAAATIEKAVAQPFFDDRQDMTVVYQILDSSAGTLSTSSIKV